MASGETRCPAWVSSQVVAGLACALALAPSLAAQEMVALQGAGDPALLDSERTVLEAPGARRELACLPDSGKAVLGFDLRFHAGYKVEIPLKEVAGDGGLIRIVFRVEPEQAAAQPFYFLQTYTVPPMDPGAGGTTTLRGGFELGEGKYHVAWLMRDPRGRVCSSEWDLDAQLAARDRGMELDIPAGVARLSEADTFHDDPPAGPRDAASLHVKLLVNFAPQNPDSSTLDWRDESALTTFLRQFSRDPRIASISLVVFNLQEQRVIFRQSGEGTIGFRALGDAVRTLTLGTASASQLSRKHADAEFISDLLSRELAGEPYPDAFVIAGPRASAEGVSEESMRSVGPVAAPVYCLSFVFDSAASPWRDAIASAARHLRGAEFVVGKPRDVFFISSDILGRIMKSRLARQGSAALSPR